MKVAVIGAGPAGITAAYEISKAIKEGKISELDVYEISKEVGGMAKSFRLWDQTVDLGPHRFFSNDRKINELWLEVAGKDYDIVHRQTRIFYKKKFFDYPIKAFNALSNLGIFEAALCVISYFWQKIFPVKNDGSFESWVTRRFGKRLYRIFFKTYSEKLWGIKCTELDSDFASQRIKKLSLFEAIKNAILQGKGNKHKTLVDQFAYPIGGTGSIYNKMAEAVKRNGGKVHLSKGVEKVITSGRKITGLILNNGEEISYDRVISSMPLTHLVSRLPETPHDILEVVNKLKFRNTIMVYLKVNKTDLFKDQWLYIHSYDLETGRITNFRNWVPQLYGDEKSSIICMEYWCNFEDDEWKRTDEEYIELGKKEFSSTGLLEDGEILDGYVVRIPRCYPVYYSNYRQDLEPVEEYLKTIENLHVIGRYGAYKYNNQDHSILMGIMAAENVVNGTENDLWQINTDYEVYQESSVITKTGLVVASDS